MTTSRGRRPWYPVRPGVVWALVAVGAACGLPALLATSAWLPPTWSSTTIALREDSSPWILAAAVLAAAGADPVSRRSVMVAPWTVRAGWPAAVRAVVVMVLATWAGLMTTGGAALGVTAVRTTTGGADVAALLSVLAGAAVWVGLGYAIGAGVPKGWNLLVGLLVAAVVWVVPPTSSRSLQSIALVWGHYWPWPGDRFVTETSWFRLLFFVAVAGTLVAVAARSARRLQGSRTFVSSLTTAGLLVPVVALAVVAVVREPAPVEREVPFLASCTEIPRHTASRVCVHEGHSRLLTPLAGHLARLLDLAAPSVPVHVVDRSVAAQEQIERPVDLGDTVTVILSIDGFGGSRDPLLGSAVSTTARALSGEATCRAAQPIMGEVPDRIRYGHDAAQVLAAELVARTGLAYDEPWPAGQPLHTGLGAMSDEHLTGWIEGHEHEIRTCGLDVRQAP